MDFRDFMDISYSLALEDHARINPLQGLEALSEKIVPLGRKMQQIPKQTDVKSQNTESLAALNAILSRVPDAPIRKKPRRA